MSSQSVKMGGKHWVLLLCLGIVVLVPGFSFAAPCSVTSEFSGNHSQSGRVFRDGSPSSCPRKAYPGIYDEGNTFYYETFTYSNTSGAPVCVTINWNPNAGENPCASSYNAHPSAYLNSYDPTNQGTNFLGDRGSSDTGSFSVEVPAASDLVIVVTNTFSPQTCSFGFSVENIVCDGLLPSVATQGVTDIGTHNATGNGTITELGFYAPSAHGLCWNTNGTPTTQGNHTDEGPVTTPGPFSSSMTNLSPDTTYYVRAYATNAGGTAYGDEVTFTTEPPAQGIPTLSEWGVFALAVLMGTAAIVFRRKSNPAA